MPAKGPAKVRCRCRVRVSVSADPMLRYERAKYPYFLVRVSNLQVLLLPNANSNAVAVLS